MRYETMDAANADNKIGEVERAASLPIVGLVDEEHGGIVGYLSADLAEEIVSSLNKIPKMRAALHVEAGFRQEKAVELEENEEGVYEPEDIQAQHDRATDLLELAR
jgi:hypothetical protein